MSADKTYRFESSKTVSDNGLREHTLHFPKTPELRFSIKILSITAQALQSFQKPNSDGISQNDLILIVEQNELISQVTLERTLNASEQMDGSSFRYVLSYDRIPIYTPVDPAANDESTTGIYEFQGSYDFSTRQQESSRKKDEQADKDKNAADRSNEAAKMEQESRQNEIDKDEDTAGDKKAAEAAAKKAQQEADAYVASSETGQEVPETAPPSNEEVLAIMEQVTFQTNTLPDNIIYYKDLSKVEKWFLADWPHFMESLISNGNMGKFNLDWNIDESFNLQNAYKAVQKEYTQFKHDNDVLNLNLFSSSPPGLTNVIPDWNEFYFNNANVFIRKNYPGFNKFRQHNFRKSQSSKLLSTPTATSFWSVPKINRKTLALRKELLHSATGTNLDESGNPPEASGKGVSANLEIFHTRTIGNEEQVTFYVNGFSNNITKHSISYYSLSKQKIVKIVEGEVPDPGKGTSSNPFRAFKVIAKIPREDIQVYNLVFYHDLYYNSTSMPVRNEYPLKFYKNNTIPIKIIPGDTIYNENAIIFTVDIDLATFWFPSYDAEYNANPYANPLTSLIARQGISQEPAKVLYLEIVRTNGIESHRLGPFIVNTIVQGTFENITPIPQKNTLNVMKINPDDNTITLKYIEGTETMNKFRLPPQTTSSKYSYIIRPSILTLGVDYFLTTGDAIAVNRTAPSGRRFFYDAYSSEHPALRYGYAVNPAKDAQRSFNHTLRYARYSNALVIDDVSFGATLYPGHAKFERCVLKFLRGASVDSEPPATAENEVAEITYKEYTYDEYIHPYFNMSIKIPYSLARISDMAQITAEIVEAPLDGWRQYVPDNYEADVPTDADNPNRRPDGEIVLSEFFPTTGITKFCDFTFPFWAQYVHDFFLIFIKMAYPSIFAETDFFVKIRYRIRFFNNGELIEGSGSYFDYDYYDRTDMIKSTVFNHILETTNKVAETDKGQKTQEAVSTAEEQRVIQLEDAAAVPSEDAASNKDQQGASGSATGSKDGSSDQPATVAIGAAEMAVLY